MKKGFLFTVVSFLMLLVASCGPRINGKLLTVSREVSPFEAIEMSIPANAVVIIREGGTPALKMEGYSDVLEKIKTEVRDNTLHIYTDSGLELNFDEATKVEIVVGSLSSLAVAGAGDIRTKGNIKIEKFALSVAGAAEVKIEELTVDALTVSAAGASDIDIKKGNARTAQYDLSGTGDIKAYGLQTSETSVSISGAGDAKVCVADELHASVSGMGDVKYKGKPRVTEDISGMGSVEDAN